MKVIIDTDPGCDDAGMLCFMLSHKDVEVLALTTVFGNATLDKTSNNACRILEYLDRTDVPVHKGSHFALDVANEKETTEHNLHIHGQDGMNNPPSIPLNVMKKPEPGTFGPTEICNLVQKYPGEIMLIAIGPLTNIAIAVKIMPQLPQLVKSLFIMGGSTKIGNVTRWAEHNSYQDALAAQLVLERFTADTIIHVVPWETCLNNTIPYDTYFDLFKNASETSKQKVILKETGWSPWDQERYDNEVDGSYRLADHFISLALLYPLSVVKTKIRTFQKIIVDKKSPKYGLMLVSECKEEYNRGIKFYETFDMKYAIEMFLDVIKER